MTRLRKCRRMLLVPAVIAAAAVSMLAPAMASAFECSARVSHTAAVYENPNGTGFIKNKSIGELVTGPENGFGAWVKGSFSPWVEVHVSGHPSGWMDINEIKETNTCFNPWA